MEWSEVYTKTQKNRLITSAASALRDFVKLIEDHGFKEEMEITSPMRYDVLIIKNGQLLERCFWVSSGTYSYNKTIESYEEIVERHKLTPELVLGAREVISEKLRKKANEEKEKSAAIEELQKLDRSEKIGELLAPVKIAGLDRGDRLMIDAKSGIYEKHSDGAVVTMTAMCRTGVRLGDGSVSALEALIEKYNLTAKQLADWREKIEK